MRKARFLLAALLFAGISLAAAHSSAAQENALEDSWDFGTVKQGSVLKHEFILKNTTNEAFEINNIHTSCGCAVSESGAKSLFPGESTEIKVSFNSRGYLGQVQQFVYVNTTSEELGIIKFTIKANVVKKLK